VDKHGNPYLKCVSGCRLFARGPDSLAALEIVSGWIAQTLTRMETDASYCNAMRDIVTHARRNLHAVLAAAPPAPAASAANGKEQVA
jgi:hypothetical protein